MRSRAFLRLPRGFMLAAYCAVTAACGEAPAPTVAQAYPSIDDMPECVPESPSFDCLKRLFLPLRGTDWPFGRDAVDRAYVYRDGAATQVASGWNLTALHVLDGPISSTGRLADCYAPSFEFAEAGEVIERDPCGTFLFLGGHPQSAACETTGESLTSCVDRVPISETFDIGLVAALGGTGTLEVRTDVQIGEEVFIVGNPGFLLFLTDDQATWFSNRYPLVSSGRVLALEGRGMVISNLAFPGNSGGPVLDTSGRLVGVVYTKIRDLRVLDPPTPTDPALPDHRTIAVRIDERIKARIELALAGR
jgi:hypothetical protein